MKKARIILITVLAISAIVTGLRWNELANIFKAVSSSDVLIAAQIIQGAGATAILISIVINVVISLAGVIPSVFLTGANLLVFGLYVGFLVSWAGEVIGAAISFLFYRWGIKAAAKLSTGHWKLAKTVNALSGIKQIYFLAVLRTAPFIPSGLINLFGAITTVSFTNFMMATAAGKFPALLLEAAFGYNLVTVGKNYINLGISMVVAVLFYFGIKKELNRLRKGN